MKLDYEKWGRKELFEFFNVSNPFYSLCFTLDVTRLYDYCKAKDISFYYALVYLSSKALDKVEAFRYAFMDGELHLLESRDPSFTDMKKGAENFHIVTMPCKGSIEEFCHAAAEKSRNQQSFIDMSAETGALAYYSCLPWLDITALTNEREFVDDRELDVGEMVRYFSTYHCLKDRGMNGIEDEIHPFCPEPDGFCHDQVSQGIPGNKIHILHLLG